MRATASRESARRTPEPQETAGATLLTELHALRDALVRDAELAGRCGCVATAAALQDAAQRLAAILPPVAGPAPLSTSSASAARGAGKPVRPRVDWKARAAGERPEEPEGA